MKDYEYTPLSLGRSEIRLIRLQPRRSGTDIQVEIFHAKVSSKLGYEALSYAWGCPDPTRNIYVRKSVHKLAKLLTHSKPKNTSLGVAENLFVALQHLRYESKPRVLWIDAICINQQDDVEKSAEVLEMGPVYKNARNVIVWLGPSSDNSDLALQTLQRIGEAVTYHKDEGTVGSRPGSWAYAICRGTEALRPHEDRWFAVKELIMRDWWHRLWVFPEVVLAHKANLVVGENFLDWGVSTRALRWFGMMKTRVDQQFQELDFQTSMDAIFWFKELSCSPANLNIYQALEATGPLLCSDPRDRLFAIRSLLHPANAAMIVPNYSLAVEEVYANFAKELISRQNNIQFLRYCTSARAGPSISGNLHLPSWVPDWSHVSSIDGLFVSQCTGPSRAFTRLADGNRLGVQGVQVGKLSYVSPPRKVPATDHEFRELCLSWSQLVTTDKSTNESPEIKVRFLEMIVGGFLPEKLPSARRNCPQYETVRAFLAGTDDRSDRRVDVLLSYIRRAIGGRSFFVTSTGSYGLCPESAKVGDSVAVILGCSFPLILRPEENWERACFRVVGTCYMPGIMEVEALLGPLPAGWSFRIEVVAEGNGVLMFTNGDTRTQQDPRMPLPLAWRYRYADDEEVLGTQEAKVLKDMKWQWFENVETGERTCYDPRLTPELLKERGVAIEELILI